MVNQLIDFWYPQQHETRCSHKFYCDKFNVQKCSVDLPTFVHFRQLCWGAPCRFALV